MTGITGWAQVNRFRGETRDPVLMQKRVEHDIWYIENWSLMLDIQIIILTLWYMLKGDPNAY
ncbi:MAG: sugar transferase [Bacteroidetes bacterium]|nr:sugar transferase [Bacteroidota bacterium]